MQDENLFRTIDRLTQYGVFTGLLPESERVYATNLMLDVMHLDSYDGAWTDDPAFAVQLDSENPGNALEKVLDDLLRYAVKEKIIGDTQPERDIFDTKLMNCMVPRPQQVIEEFQRTYASSPIKATEAFYLFSQNSNYLRRYRLAKDVRWSTPTSYGALDILISLSKPELDPKAIALAGKAKVTGYPKCALCRENEGYAGRINFAARQNHRVLPITLCGERFFFQFSPYGYCKHHCIILNEKHVPMVIDALAIRKILESVRLFPHYFVGSNADLPYVGGSVLSHEHFQGGWYELPIMKAAVSRKLSVRSMTTQADILNWPLSTLRLMDHDIDELVRVAGEILTAWASYSDPLVGILAMTDGEKHNTITPLACRKDGQYLLYLMLRNNRRTPERPEGLFHTRPEYYHIKKEGIGIIDAPGLAILPARLKRELSMVSQCVLSHADLDDDPMTRKHADWVRSFLPKYPDIGPNSIDVVLRNETGLLFKKMLEDCGVFKQDEQGKEAFLRFVSVVPCLGITKTE